MKVKKDIKKETPTKQKAIKTKVRKDNSVEVEFVKNPKDTLLGKIFLYLVIAGMVILPLVILIIVMIETFG